MIRRRAGLFWFTVGLAMAAAPGASADAPAATASASASLLLVVRAPSDEEAPLIDVIRDAARRRALDVTFDARAAAVLRVEIDVASSIPSVSVVDLRDDVVLTRRTLPRTGSNEVLREELALVVASAIDAARVRVPAARPTSPPVSTPPAAATELAEEKSSLATWRGDVVAELRTPRADAPLVPGVGVGLRTSFERAPAKPSIGLLATWRSPSGVDGDRVDLRSTGASLRLLAGATIVDGARFGLSTRVGPGLAIERVGARSRVPDVDARPPESVTTPIATALVDLAWRFDTKSAVALGVGADVLLTRRRVLLATPHGAEVLLTPARVQPFLQLSLVLMLGGAS